MRLLMPSVRALSRDEAEALLASNQIGRLAFSAYNRVDLEPIQYVYDAPWVFGRTTVSTRLVRLAHTRWAAFETDVVHGLFDWESVVVKGPFFALNLVSDDSDDYGRALSAVRRLIPEALSAPDPLALREVVFGIKVQ